MAVEATVICDVCTEKLSKRTLCMLLITTSSNVPTIEYRLLHKIIRNQITYLNGAIFFIQSSTFVVRSRKSVSACFNFASFSFSVIASTKSHVLVCGVC